MKISPRIEGVSGFFDTEQGRLECVPMQKHAEVLLCFADTMNIPFAKIKLHTEDLYVDAIAVFQDATALGNEIVKRWNNFKPQEECELESGAFEESPRAATQGIRDCAALLGLDTNTSPAELVETLRKRLNQ